MKWLILFGAIAWVIIISPLVWADGRVRRITVEKDQIVTVHTALGVATIIQVPDKPNSVVVGDIAGYKVEYLDTAITIKPLSGHAKSNLYIYTDYRRFNVQLVTGSESSADYVVYLENTKSKVSKKPAATDSTGVSWKKESMIMRNGDLSFKVNRLGEDQHGFLMIDFTIKSVKEIDIDPSWFWLTQSGTSHPIQNLLLSSLTVAPNHSVSGMIEILRSDLNENNPIQIELRRKKLSFLTLQGEHEWTN